MSDPDEIILKTAEWAAEKEQIVVVDRVIVELLDKHNFEGLKTLQQRYDSFKNLQIIRITKSALIGKDKGEAKLIALRAPKGCNTRGNAIHTGQELTIQERTPIYVTAGAEFVFLEKEFKASE